MLKRQILSIKYCIVSFFSPSIYPYPPKSFKASALKHHYNSVETVLKHRLNAVLLRQAVCYFRKGSELFRKR